MQWAAEATDHKASNSKYLVLSQGGLSSQNLKICIPAFLRHLREGNLFFFHRENLCIVFQNIFRLLCIKVETKLHSSSQCINYIRDPDLQTLAKCK